MSQSDTINSPQVFLSYASEDLIVIEKLYFELLKRKVNVWWDKKNIEPGAWKLQITRAITRSQYFLICISQAALKKTGNEPGFQDDELNYAWEIAIKQDEKHFTIVPIRLEVCDRGDNRLSLWQQYDLFDKWDETIDNLSKYFGGQSLNKSVINKDKTEEEKLLEALFNKFHAFYFAREFEKALSILDTILVFNPSNAVAYYDRGIINYKKDDLNKAIEDYNKAIKIDPLFSRAFYNRGLAYYEKGKLDEANADYYKATQLDLTYAGAYYHSTKNY
jgi:tetratricopeptide (TPR) repeat protein